MKHDRLKTRRSSTGQVRAKGDGSGFAGHASTWWAVDSYASAMAPGAFERTLRDRAGRIKVLYNHNRDDYIGVPDTLQEDDTGLYIEASIFDDGGVGTVFMNRLRQGAEYGLSFGFQEVRGRPATETDPLDFAQMPGLGWGQVWITTEVKLYEVSPVTFPANEDAAVEELRQRATVDALRALYDDIRSGTLADDELAVLTQIIQALPQPAQPGGETAPLVLEPAQREGLLEAEIALAKYGHYALRS